MFGHVPGYSIYTHTATRRKKRLLMQPAKSIHVTYKETTLKDCKGKYLDREAPQHSPCVASLSGQTERQRNLSAALHIISAYDLRLPIGREERLLISLCLEVFLCLEVSEKSLRSL